MPIEEGKEIHKGPQRPKTHTFHLPTGESTVTLEDVHMLMGLRVNGVAVNGRTNVDYSITQELLGAEFPERTRKEQFVKITWLRERYDAFDLNQDSTIEQIHKKTRIYILLLFASLLFPDTNGNTIHLMYLPFVIRWERTGYFWNAGSRFAFVFAKCHGKQESPPSFILSNKERKKAQKNSFFEMSLGSGG